MRPPLVPGLAVPSVLALVLRQHATSLGLGACALLLAVLVRLSWQPWCAPARLVAGGRASLPLGPGDRPPGLTRLARALVATLWGMPLLAWALETTSAHRTGVAFAGSSLRLAPMALYLPLAASVTALLALAAAHEAARRLVPSALHPASAGQVGGIVRFACGAVLLDWLFAALTRGA